jgi:hypothetical protein
MSAASTADVQPKKLAVFTLVRGGESESDYESFISSRHCLRDSLPASFSYDDVVFHEGNVAVDMQNHLRREL